MTYIIISALPFEKVINTAVNPVINSIYKKHLQLESGRAKRQEEARRTGKVLDGRIP